MKTERGALMRRQQENCMRYRVFELQQGTRTCDGSINWQVYEVYTKLANAKADGQKNKGFWRVVENKVVWETPFPAHKIEGSQAEFDRYITGDR